MDSKLREVPGETQSARFKGRRWFNSSIADLYVWYENEQIERFEYSYRKPHDEHILVWRLSRGFDHRKVDDGESNPGKNQSPIIGQDTLPDFEEIARDFRESGICIEPEIYRFVMGKLYNNL